MTAALELIWAWRALDLQDLQVVADWCNSQEDRSGED